MKHSHYDYCIVGAGPSGLTAAYEFLKAGKKVLLIERDDRVGGLSKSYNYDGHIFDTGPKRFHTDDTIVLDFINEVMAMDTIGRSTKVFFFNNYYTWPLKTTELYKLPPTVALQSFFDLLKKREINDPRSFKEYIISKYGNTLYSIFFKPYTEKFLRWPAEDIHSDWASTGINRTVIDKRVKANSLFDLVSSIALPQKIETNFLYPTEGGFGGFFDKLYDLCKANENFDLMLNTSIRKLVDRGEKFEALTKEDKSISFRDLIWSGNLNDLHHLIAPVEHSVNYLNTIFYNLICKEEGIGKNRAQWIYVSRGDTLISRITSMKEMSPYTCRGGYYNFICELTDCPLKPIYLREPEAYTDAILSELENMRFIKSRKFVEGIKINAVADTYPIYHKRYHRDFANIARVVRQFSKRIYLLGRLGAFWYNNSDHSIRMALDMAAKLLGRADEFLDYRGYFGGTHRENETIE